MQIESERARGTLDHIKFKGGSAQIAAAEVRAPPVASASYLTQRSKHFKRGGTKGMCMEQTI